MTGLAASIVQRWVRLYTVGFETTVRERIRQEVEDDLWEQTNSRDASNKPIREAMIIILRWLLGIPADVQRIMEEYGSRGFSRWTKKFLGLVKPRKSWVFLLIVLIFCVSMLFLGIRSFIIAGIVYIGYKTRQSKLLTQAQLRQYINL